MSFYCPESSQYLIDDPHLKRNQKRTQVVVGITFVMMVVEIVYGYVTHSMALLADGWHMASHVGALSLSLLSYMLARSRRVNAHFSFGAGKLIPLSGYTSGLFLVLIALVMMLESGIRLMNPVVVNFEEALIVAFIGLVVNIVSALVLSGFGSTPKDHHHHHHHHHHHDHDHHDSQDHNLKSATAHVLADALTSVLALVALLVGKYYGQLWMDPLMGIVGGVVILKWSYGLCKETLWDLLDGSVTPFDMQKLKDLLADNQAELMDLHVWRVAPRVLAGQMVVRVRELKGADYYRSLLQAEFGVGHVVVEERQRPG